MDYMSFFLHVIGAWSVLSCLFVFIYRVGGHSPGRIGVPSAMALDLGRPLITQNDGFMSPIGLWTKQADCDTYTMPGTLNC